MSNVSAKAPRLNGTFVAAIVLLSMALRLLHYNQSLWCDEMTTLLGYVDVPWSKIIAPGAGEYVPNDHPLFGILAKICLTAGGGSMGHSASYIAGCIRLPSLIAGSLLPVAVAWPLRQRWGVAWIVALFAAFNPWLIAFSDESRGYSLMLLLGVIATNLLPRGDRRWPVKYAFASAAMLCTVPVAGVLLIAHGLWMLLFNRRCFGNWIRGAIMTMLLTLIVYLPMTGGILFYLRHPMHTPESLADLINQLPRFAIAGEYFPTGGDPLSHAPVSNLLSMSWLTPVIVLMMGSILARRDPDLAQSIGVWAIAGLVCVVFAAAIPSLAEVRFASWSAIWFVFSAAALVRWIGLRTEAFIAQTGRPGIDRPNAPLAVCPPAFRHAAVTIAGITAALCITVWFGYRDFTLLPSQPVREAMMQTDSAAPPGAAVMMTFLSGYESAAIYGRQTVPHHPLLVANDPAEFQRLERQAIARTGRPPWVIMSFEYMPKNASPSFWKYFESRYAVKERLRGRITPVAIYMPR